MKFTDLAWAALLSYYRSAGDRKYVKLFADTEFLSKLRERPQDMPDEEFGLFRWYCIDNAQIRLFLPRGVAKFDLKNIQVPFDYKTIQRDPNLVSTEIAIWEDNRPSIEAINGMDYDLQAVRIIAMGYRFHTVELEKDVIAKIQAGMTACTDVIASGYGATA